MREIHVPLPEVALIAVTRAALGAGLGLVLASQLTGRQRQTIGWTLMLIGGLATIPLGADVLRRMNA